MPQASEELRSKMRARFDSIDIFPPLQFLKNSGWSSDRGFLSPPNCHITDAEWECVDFLCEEWDYAYNPMTK